MKGSGLHSYLMKRFSNRDWLGMSLLLLLGISGMLSVSLLRDPLIRMSPMLPMLSPQDWPGSEVTQPVFIGDISAPWEEQRTFQMTLSVVGEPSTIASIDQRVIWYADRSRATAAWEELDTGTYNGWDFKERQTEGDQPQSFLACNPDLVTSPPQCWYLAYWKHWRAETFFWRQSDENFLLRDIEQLTDRVDQLLMSAPEEPCYGRLCTNR
jgi:hypothetical protein